MLYQIDGGYIIALIGKRYGIPTGTCADFKYLCTVK